jgi:hypothetical protein
VAASPPPPPPPSPVSDGPSRSFPCLASQPCGPRARAPAPVSSLPPGPPPNSRNQPLPAPTSPCLARPQPHPLQAPHPSTGGWVVGAQPGFDRADATARAGRRQGRTVGSSWMLRWPDNRPAGCRLSKRHHAVGTGRDPGGGRSGLGGGRGAGGCAGRLWRELREPSRPGSPKRDCPRHEAECRKREYVLCGETQCRERDYVFRDEM